MEKLLSLLNSSHDVVLNVNVFLEDDTIMLTNAKFTVYDYYDEDDHICLVQSNGAELILPKDSCVYFEDEEGDNWRFKQGDLEVYIYEE